jgi:putative cell wall-binding protein
MKAQPHGRSPGTKLFALLLSVILFVGMVPFSAVGAEVATVPEGHLDISGTVTEEVSATPLPDMLVKAYYDSELLGGDYHSTYTDDFGQYEFRDLPVGNYVVKFYDTNYAEGGAYQWEYYDDTPERANATTISVDGTATTTGVDAALTPLEKAIEGKVTAPDAPGGVKGVKAKLWKWTGGGTPVGDPDMASLACHWGEVQSMYTDAAGGFGFWGLDEGYYRVGIFDYNGVYVDQFYMNKAHVEEATDIVYNGTDLVSGINIALEKREGEAKEVWDNDRFTTAIDAAKVAYPNWEGIDTIVIAAGDDRAAADPLAAAGLCWAYNAPLFLVSKDGPPHEVKNAIYEIVKKNGPVKMVVVGGPVSIPDWVPNKIEDYVEAKFGGADKITGPNATWRRVNGEDRYALAATIADEMAASGKGMSNNALIANGANPDKFFDALALSPIARREGAPVLLVSQDKVPAATKIALDKHPLASVWIAGGEKSVGPKAKAELEEYGTVREQWAGADRYQTARLVAEGAIERGWLSKRAAGIAAKLPDALTGGSVVGARNGVLLLCETEKLPAATAGYLEENREDIQECYIFGGPKSVHWKTRALIDEKLK